MNIGKVISVLKQPRRGVDYMAQVWKRIAAFQWRESIESVKSMYRFMRQEVPANSVLIVEPNMFHGEILPGFCRYFQELGFNVTLLVRRENFHSGIFCRYPNGPRIFCFGKLGMKLALKSKRVSKFRMVLLTSTIFAEKYIFFGFYFDYLGFAPRSNNGYLVIVHHFPEVLPLIESGAIDMKRILLLSNYRDNKYTVPMLNPHYFGLVKHPDRHETARFITVGTISSRNRNFSLLISSVNQLLSKGIRNFEIVVVGRGVTRDPSMKLPENVIILGELSFKDLFNKVEDSDYFLPLLDPRCEGHRRYLAGETTGSRQLILGFAKVPVIHELFAIAYNFTANNSFLHGDDGLAAAMEQAIHASREQYKRMQADLLALARQVHDESLYNLRTKLACLSETGERH
jgi:hypothetical protein